MGDGIQGYKQYKTGVTFIELVIVIAIIGILAAAAFPRLVHITTNARIAATTAISGALSASNASNYAARKFSSTLGMPVGNCMDIANVMLGGVPTNYTITSNATSVDASTACTITGPNSTSETFTATGIN